MAIRKYGESNLRVLEGDRAVSTASALGVSTESLHAAMSAGHLAAKSLTRFHPKISAGIAFWEDAVAQFREIQAASGWGFEDPQNLPLTISPSGGVAVSFAAGCGMTGLPHAGELRLSRKRGVATKRAAENNEQLALELEFSSDAEEVVGVERWVVVYFRDFDKREVRIELALPIKVTDDGAVTGWHQRLVLPPWSMDGPSPEATAGGGDDVVFPVGPR